MQDTRYKYKYEKYVAKIAYLQQGGARKTEKVKPASDKETIKFENQNKDIFLNVSDYRKISRSPLSIGNNNPVKMILSDPTYDFDNTFVTEIDVYNSKGEWKNEILDG